MQTNVSDFAVPESDENLIYDGWNALCDRYAKPVFFEKSPHHSHHPAALGLMLEWIKTTACRVRVIGLVRNPMAVMHSALNLFHTDPVKRQFGWLFVNRNILRFGEKLGREQFTLVRYEDMVVAPASFFAGLCNFIGVDYQETMGHSVNDQSMTKWVDNSKFTLQLDSEALQFAKELGYCDEELVNPPKPSSGMLSRIGAQAILELKRVQSRMYNAYKRFTR